MESKTDQLFQQPLTDAIDGPLKIGKLLGLLPFQEVSNGRHRIRPLYTTATVITLAAFAGSTFWHVKMSLKTVDSFVAKNSPPIALFSLGVAHLAMHTAVWLELVCMLLKLRSCLDVLNGFARESLPRRDLETIRGQIRRRAWILAAVGSVFAAGSVFTLTSSGRYEHCAFLPIMPLYTAMDVIVVGYASVAPGFVHSLNRQLEQQLQDVGNVLENLPRIQARHGAACDWVEKVCDCFAHGVMLRVLNAFLMSLAAFVGAVNFDPMIFGNVGNLLMSMAGAIALGFQRLYAICYFSNLGIDEVKETSAILSKVDTTGYTHEKRMLVHTFLQQVQCSKPEITASGFFPIGKGLLLTVLGHVGTYVVVVLQFNTPTCNS